MFDEIRFNIGGQRFKISRSLLEKHPNSLLAEEAFNRVHSRSPKEIVLARNGSLFVFVLVYLRGNGHVILPMTISTEVFMAELRYYEIDIFEAGMILQEVPPAAQSLSSVLEGIRAEIDSWSIYLAIVVLAQSCASMHFETNRELEIFVRRDPTQMACSKENWHALYLLLRDGGEQICQLIREDCSKYLQKVGLKVISIGADPQVNFIAVGMTFTEARSALFATHDELDALVSSTAAANLDDSSDHSP